MVSEGQSEGELKDVQLTGTVGTVPLLPPHFLSLSALQYYRLFKS